MGYTDTQVHVPVQHLCPCVLVSRYTKFLFFCNFSRFMMNLCQFLADFPYSWWIFANFANLHRLFNNFLTFLSKKIVILRYLLYQYTCKKLNKSTLCPAKEHGCSGVPRFVSYHWLHQNAKITLPKCSKGLLNFLKTFGFKTNHPQTKSIQ